MATEEELKEATRQMIYKLYQAVVGIPENPEDNGLIGDVKKINDKLDIVNGRTRGNETRSKVNQAIIAVILGGGGLSAGITKLLDLW